MALFQPTNVIPSSFTVGVVDAEKNIAQVSWQVNGNSAMTSYEIDFYKNDANSNRFYGTGKIATGIPDGGFYGTDRFGQPKMFTWAGKDNLTWSALSSDFKNGSQFKLKITQYWFEGGVEQSVSSIEYYVCEMRSTPQVTIYLSDEEYQIQKALDNGTELPVSIAYFKADYTQMQGEAVRTARWQIATASLSNNQWQLGEVISDTGEVPTPALQFEFNGFFNGEAYAVRCIVESEGGQMAENPASQNEGWIFFRIYIAEQFRYTGNFTMQCLPKENAALLSWTSKHIPPVVTGDYGFSGSFLKLSPGATMSWSEAGGFAPPWAVAIQFVLQNDGSDITNPIGNIANITHGSFSVDIIGSWDKSAKEYTLQIGGASVASFPITLGGQYQVSTAISVIITMGNGGSSSPDNRGRIYVYLTVGGDTKKVFQQNNIFLFGAIKDVTIYGQQGNTLFYGITVYANYLPDRYVTRVYGSTFAVRASWYDPAYTLQMSPNFSARSIDGGNVTRPRIYRQEIGTNKLFPIYYDKVGEGAQLKDYGILSRKSYTYWLYASDLNDTYTAGTQCTFPGSDEAAIISTCFKSYSLLVCDYDSVNDAYHVRKQYLFALNLSEGSIGNNNSPTMNANFTAYPTRMPSTQNYASGTLQGLIGAIYTVPALIEQIGGFKHTAKPSTLDYFDNVDLEKELYDLSVAPYQLFLRDVKGHLRMVATNSAISMTQNLKNKHLSTTISLPWVEIGDASDVTIIQTPDDYGWNNDEQVLDVRLDVDPETGVLSATYPKPYNGTKFYLTGINKEILATETPTGITPAQFELSETATESDDGSLTATAKVNKEGED